MDCGDYPAVQQAFPWLLYRHCGKEGDRSMFSADVFLAKHVSPPKDGPVPN